MTFEEEVLALLEQDVSPPTSVASLARWTCAIQPMVSDALRTLQKRGLARPSGTGWIPAKKKKNPSPPQDTP